MNTKLNQILDEISDGELFDKITILEIKKEKIKNEEKLLEISKELKSLTKTLEDEILRLGGNPIIWKTGYSYIKQKMKEISCNFAGEMSGHIFIGDIYYGFDDGIYVGARFIEMLSKQNIKLSDLVEQLPKYFSTPEMRIECISDKEKFRINV